MGVPGALLPLTILLELGGLAILFGFLTPHNGYLYQCIIYAVTALLFHTNFAEGANPVNVYENMTIAGGYLLLVITGPGKWSLDRLFKKIGNNRFNNKRSSRIFFNCIIKL